MITEQWLRQNAAVVPNNASIFVRHPRHFIMNIPRIGWTRFTADDAPTIGNQLKMMDQARRHPLESLSNPERIVEHSASVGKLLDDRTLQTVFRSCFGQDESIPASLDLIRATFPQADQVILLLPGGASWFIWNLKQEVL